MLHMGTQENVRHMNRYLKFLEEIYFVILSGWPKLELMNKIHLEMLSIKIALLY